LGARCRPIGFPGRAKLTSEAFAGQDVRKMYLESVEWVLGKTEGSVTPHPKVN
jgi:hypothetical protein